MEPTLSSRGAPATRDLVCGARSRATSDAREIPSMRPHLSSPPFVRHSTTTRLAPSRYDDRVCRLPGRSPATTVTARGRWSLPWGPDPLGGIARTTFYACQAKRTGPVTKSLLRRGTCPQTPGGGSMNRGTPSLFRSGNGPGISSGPRAQCPACHIVVPCRRSAASRVQAFSRAPAGTVPVSR